MKKKVMIASVALGVGTLGYWLVREFKKSDRTFSGIMSTAGKDVHTGYDSSRQAAKRVYSALRAGVQDWREDRSTDQSLSITTGRNDRGNGGTHTGKASLPIYPSESLK